MPAVIPSVFTPVHDEEVASESSVTEQTVHKIIRNINFLGDLVPLGTIGVLNINQVGVSPIDGTVWQLCNGSEITNPQSPLRSLGLNTRFVPNINEQYIRNAGATTGNATGGSWDFPLGHNHGGNTGGRNPPSGNEYQEDEGDGVRRIGPDHNHSISSALGTITIDYPQWLKVAAYMKVQ